MIRRYRRRAYTVHAVRWLGEENCEEVFAFLGLEHPDDELDHECIHFDNPDGGTDTVFPGEWVVANDRGPGHRAYQDRLFRVAFEAEEQPPHPPHDSWLVELLLDDGEWHVAYPTHDRDMALDRLRARRASSPDRKWRLVRMTDSYAVEIGEDEEA